MKELTIRFYDRPQGRRFLRISKKHPLFKKHFVSWEARKILYKFDNEEQGKVVADIIIAVAKELDFKIEVL